MTMILLLMTMNSILLIFLSHPLSMGMILLIQTILICLMSGIMNLSFWYSYILLLIMVGGMLVLFLYMTSIASNEKFKISFPLFIFMMLIMIITFSLLKNMMFFNNFNSEMIVMSNNLITFKSSFSKYMNISMIIIYIIMIIYLLITMIAVVKITKINYGPLRQKF